MVFTLMFSEPLCLNQTPLSKGREWLKGTSLLTQATNDFFLFFDSTGTWTQGWCLLVRSFTTWATPPTLFLFCVISKLGSHELFVWGCLQMAVLLISASWVAKITSMRHQQLAPPTIFIFYFIIFTFTYMCILCVGQLPTSFPTILIITYCIKIKTILPRAEACLTP
jgi:hypothetical protein